MKLFLTLFALLFSVSAAAQDYIDPEWISTEKRTVRSVHVDSADLVGEPYWCGYAVDKYIKDFMDDEKRNEYRSVSWLTIGNRSSSCVWMDDCKKGWDKMESILEGSFKASKTIQYEKLQKKRQRIEEYNQQAVKEGQPLKKVPQGLEQLRGDTDGEIDFVHISIDQLKDVLKKNCMVNQVVKKIEIKTDLNLTKENKRQDEAYISAKQYALGAFNNIHYRFVEMQQNHVLISWFDEIYSGNYIYNIQSQTISEQP